MLQNKVEYKIVHYETFDKSLIYKLKKRFTNVRYGRSSYMNSQLKKDYNLTGAMVAFSKGGYIIGWSSVEDMRDSYRINTFVSKRYRHKGIGSQLVRKCVETYTNRPCLIATTDIMWVKICYEDTRPSMLRVKGNGSADKTTYYIRES